MTVFLCGHGCMRTKQTLTDSPPSGFLSTEDEVPAEYGRNSFFDPLFSPRATNRARVVSAESKTLPQTTFATADQTKSFYRTCRSPSPSRVRSRANSIDTAIGAKFDGCRYRSMKQTPLGCCSALPEPAAGTLVLRDSLLSAH